MGVAREGKFNLVPKISKNEGFPGKMLQIKVFQMKER